MTPTRTLSAPTLESSPVVRGEFPTFPPSSAGQNDPTAAAQPNDGDLPPLAVATPAPGQTSQRVQVVLPSGGIIAGDFYAAANGQRAPGVLLLTADASGWLDLPLRLQAANFTALAVDLADTATVADVGGLLISFSDSGGVDPAQIAVIGAGRGADLALAACAVDQRCDALALLSPTDATADQVALAQYNPRPLFLSAATDDETGALTAETLLSGATGAVTFESVSGAERGVGLLRVRPDLADALIGWLQGRFTL